MIQRSKTPNSTIELCAYCKMEPIAPKKNPFFGKSLCAKCLRKNGHTLKGELPNKCEKCGCKSKDPVFPKKWIAHKSFIGFAGYYCDLCSLPNGIPDFIKTRVGDMGRDMSLLIEKIGVEATEDYDPTDEEQWFIYIEDGKNFGEDWEKYLVEYTGIILPQQQFSTDIPIENNSFGLPKGRIKSPLWLLWHPKDGRNIIQLCRQRVFYKYSLAYINIIFDTPSPNIEIKNVEKIRTQKELLAVWIGSNPSLRLTMNLGTPPEYTDKEKFVQDVTAACFHLFDKHHDTRFKAREIADSLLIKRRTLYETAQKFNVTLDDIRTNVRNSIKEQIIKI